MIHDIFWLLAAIVLILFSVYGFFAIRRMEKKEDEWRVQVLLHLAVIRDNQVSLASYLQD